MKIDVQSEIASLLNEENVNIAEDYNEVIHEVNKIGFISNTESMYEMNKMLFDNAKLLAEKFFHHSLYETMGGNLINTIAHKYADGKLQYDMLSQAKDELKHGRMLESLIKYTGESAEEIKNEVQLNDQDNELPDFKDDVKIFICFVHAAEIRTLVMLNQYTDIIKLKNDENLNQMLTMLEIIRKDERRHAAYTGNYINKWVEEQKEMKNILFDCFLYTNKESLQEIANMASNFAKTYQ